MAASDAKIPVTILTGFLGAGKTTLLNHILKSPDHGLKFAVIENEFGAVGIDDGVLQQEAADEQIIEMMNGCICCTVRADLSDVLLKLKERLKTDKFDAVLIETTGLADPSPVAQTFFVDEKVSPFFKLDGIITVVDAKHILAHLHEKREEGKTNEAVEQIAFADRILMNKTDLVTEAEIAKVTRDIRAINKGAEIIRSHMSVVPPSKLLNIEAFELDKVLEVDPKWLGDDEEEKHGHGHGHGHAHGEDCADDDCGHDHGHAHGADCADDDCGHDHGHGHGEAPKEDAKAPSAYEQKHGSYVSSVSFKFEADLNVNLLQSWIGELMKTKGESLYRYKGILSVKGMSKKFVFQGVHMLFTGNFSEKDWAEGEKRECRFVFIGKDLDKEELTKGFLDCVVEEGSLRFKVGDLVEANVGSWVNAKIVRVWDEGNPYRMELEDGNATNVWGPADDDMYVRARAAAVPEV